MKNLISLHLIVFILGFTALLGKLISVPAIELVWFRMLIASAALFVFLKFRNLNYALPFKMLSKIFLVGLLVAVHWMLFFHSIKVSNVSVALSCFSSIALFTGFIEPYFHKRKISLREVALGTLVVAGIYIIFRFETRYTYGIVLAVLAALTGSLFIVLNGKLIKQHPAPVISFYELLAGFAGITVFRFFQPENHFRFSLPASDWFYLLVLGIVCTAYAFMKTIDLMKVLSPFHITLTINLEPVYGIILAYLILGESEKMTGGFYAGTAVVLLAVFIYPLLGKK